MIKNLKVYFDVLGLGGLVDAIKSKATGSAAIRRVERPDCKYPILLRAPSSDVFAYEQVFINQEYDFTTTKPPNVIIDAGANIGLASIYFANRFPNAKIISIEPEESNFNLLKANTSSYKNIIPVHAALWNKVEEIDIIDPGLGKWGFMTEVKGSPGSLPGETCHSVAGLTIDKIMSDHGLDHIDILKIDIEGAEKEVFENCSSWIRKVESMIVELHDRMKPGCNRSFYCNTNGFDQEWLQGENVYLSRGSFLRKSALSSS